MAGAISSPPTRMRYSAAPAARVRIMGAPVNCLSEADVVRTITQAACTRSGNWTITANLDHLRRYRREPLARTLIDTADLVVADGTPLLWASRLAGTRLPERVAGSNMIWSLAQAASEQQLSVFLLGGAPGVAERAASVLRERYSGLRVAGTLCPSPGFEHDEDELAAIVETVAAAAPQLVFVALGFPKQDVLIGRLQRLLPCAAFVGVGISLSFVSGELRRAPHWMRRAGLEWLYRLGQEPRRLMRRYLSQGLPFAGWLMVAAVVHRLSRAGEGSLWGPLAASPIARAISRPVLPPARAGAAHSEPER
jgi:N-acetylglucosaminyldiphosphoundecaprenol N-acetyl-beta-D-mannosaminyltransferase